MKKPWPRSGSHGWFIGTDLLHRTRAGKEEVYHVDMPFCIGRGTIMGAADGQWCVRDQHGNHWCHVDQLYRVKAFAFRELRRRLGFRMGPL